MDSTNLDKVTKNKYFIPIVIGVAIALVGIIVGVSLVRKASRDTEEKLLKLKGEKTETEKKSLKSLLFGSEKYELNYADYDSSLVENVSLFETDEHWQGNGNFDNKTFYEGESGIALISGNRKPAEIFLEKNLDLSDFKKLEFFMNIDDVEYLETATFKLGDSSLENYYHYSITNLKNGWNLVSVSQDQFIAKTTSEFSWKNIKKIQFEVVSRLNAAVTVNFDYLTARKSSDYLDKWNVVNEEFLGLGKKDDKISLSARSVAGSGIATLAEVSGDDINWQASFIPQVKGRVGLFFRGDYRNSQGYYLLADGVGKSSFTLNKRGVDGWEKLAATDIVNFTFSANKKYWLKAEAKEDKITGYLSQNGKDFTELFSAEDGEFKTGGVGIAVFDKSYALFDSFSFKAVK